MEVPTGAALAEQVPALVERDLELLEAFGIGCIAGADLVLLLDQLVDLGDQRVVGHGVLLVDRGREHGTAVRGDPAGPDQAGLPATKWEFSQARMSCSVRPYATIPLGSCDWAKGGHPDARVWISPLCRIPPLCSS